MCLLLAGSMSCVNVAADEAATDYTGKWKITGEVYLWGASIGGTSASGSDIDVDFDTIFDDLDFAFMGNLAAKRDKWTLLSDVIYMNLSQSGKNAASIPVGPLNVPVNVDADAKLKAWIVNALAGYNLIENDKNRLDLMGGVRYLYLDSTVKLDVDVGQFPGVEDKTSVSGSNWDGVVGVRGRLNLSEKW